MVRLPRYPKRVLKWVRSSSDNGKKKAELVCPGPGKEKSKQWAWGRYTGLGHLGCVWEGQLAPFKELERVWLWSCHEVRE